MTWLTGRQFTIALGVFTLVELLSWFAYQGPWWQAIITSVLIVGLIILAWKRPSWLGYASVAELVIGGKGYLFYLAFGGTKVSIRMLIFAILLIRVLSVLVREWSAVRSKILSPAFLLFVAWIGVAVVTALVRGTPLASIFYDVNAYLYLAALPAWWLIVRVEPKWRQHLVAIILGGACVVGLESWLMVLLFGRDLSNIHTIYTWIRNTGIGEITYINNNIYRVFFQSHIYTVLAFLFTLVIWLRERTPRWWFVPLGLSALGIYISLSRSLWLGLGLALLTTVAWLVKRRQWRSVVRLWVLLPLAIFSWAMMVWAISWPQFTLHGTTTALNSRLQGTGSADAATARRNQVKPLLTAIGKHPVWGSGFGQTVTYYSTDPTINGWRTTTAFELGYLDTWLKIGLVGLGLYAAWIIGLWRKIRGTVWAEPMIIAGLALVTVHLTTPYLNHPLGLGWLMLTALFAYDPV